MKSLIKNALSVLTRVSKDYPDREPSLHAFILKDLPLHALLAIEVAQEHDGGEPIGRILADCLERHGDIDLFLDIYEKLPSYSVSLREVYLTVTKKMINIAQRAGKNDWELLAEVSGAYATALTDTGEYAQALPYALKSACYYQRYESNKKDITYRSLSNLGECLINIGEIADCVLVQTESVAGYEYLTGVNPEKYIPHYANSLLVLSSHYMIQERFSEALGFCLEAENQIIRIKNPNVEHSFIHHRIVSNLAICYEHTHQLDLAVKLLRDKIKRIRDLANFSPDCYTIDLIEALKVLASIESNLGNKQDALTIMSEAISRIESLYQLRPQAFASDYVNLLINLSLIDTTFGGFVEANQKMKKATEILNPLYKRFPKRFANTMAALQNNYVGIHLALCNYESALSSAYDSLRLYRILRQKNNVAMSLNTLANIRLQLGDIVKAIRSIKSAIRISKKLSLANQLYLIDLAIYLGTLASIYDQVDEYELAISEANKAINFWNNELSHVTDFHSQQYLQVARVRLSCLYELGRLKEGIEWAEYLLIFIDEYEQLDARDLASILHLYALILNQSGKLKESVEMSKQEVECLRTLPFDKIPSYKVELADALVNLSFMQVEAGDDLAFQTIQEAVCVYETLSLPLAPAVLVNKATALFNQASMAYINGNDSWAIKSLEAAIIDQRQLVEIDGVIASYPTDLLSSLQLLANIYFRQNDIRFLVTANELDLLLDQLPIDPEVLTVKQELKILQVNFKEKIS